MVRMRKAGKTYKEIGDKYRISATRALQIIRNEMRLQEMERHPVKPGTVVYIPKHPEEGVEKKAPARRKLPPTPEQQIKKLKKKVTWLRIFLVLTMLFCSVLSFIVSQMVTELDFYRFLGQNYSTVETLDTSSATP